MADYEGDEAATDCGTMAVTDTLLDMSGRRDLDWATGLGREEAGNARATEVNLDRNCILSVVVGDSKAVSMDMRVNTCRGSDHGRKST